MRRRKTDKKDSTTERASEQGAWSKRCSENGSKTWWRHRENLTVRERERLQRRLATQCKCRAQCPQIPEAIARDVKPLQSHLAITLLGPPSICPFCTRFFNWKKGREKVDHPAQGDVIGC